MNKKSKEKATQKGSSKQKEITLADEIYKVVLWGSTIAIPLYVAGIGITAWGAVRMGEIASTVASGHVKTIALNALYTWGAINVINLGFYKTVKSNQKRKLVREVDSKITEIKRNNPNAIRYSLSTRYTNPKTSKTYLKKKKIDELKELRNELELIKTTDNVNNKPKTKIKRR